MNFGYGGWIHSKREDIVPCKLDQINADPQRNWYWLAWKEIDQQIIHVSECEIKSGPGETRSMKTRRGVRQGCCLSPILFQFHRNALPRKPLKGLETSK